MNMLQLKEYNFKKGKETACSIFLLYFISVSGGGGGEVILFFCHFTSMC